jgi:hypothetical protein
MRQHADMVGVLGCVRMEGENTEWKNTEMLKEVQRSGCGGGGRIHKQPS